MLSPAIIQVIIADEQLSEMYITPSVSFKCRSGTLLTVVRVRQRRGMKLALFIAGPVPEAIRQVTAVLNIQAQRICRRAFCRLLHKQRHPIPGTWEEAW